MSRDKLDWVFSVWIGVIALIAAALVCAAVYYVVDERHHAAQMQTMGDYKLAYQPMISLVQNGGMQSGSEVAAQYDKQVLNYAVLDVLYEKLPFTDQANHLSQAEGACDLKAIEEARVWARTLPDKQVQGGYLKWLGFFEGRVRERMRPEKTESEKEQDEMRRQLNAGAALADKLPQPPLTTVHCVK